MHSIPSENNEDFQCIPLTLRKESHWFLNRINGRHLYQNFIHGEKRLSTRTDYAVQFFSKENLKELVDSNKTVRFKVLAKHSLSGFSVVKIYDFKHKNDFINGSFLSGNTSRIKE